MPLDPGTRLGPYELIAPLGAGGMGEVYRARDTRLGREVAIKVLPPSTSDDHTARERFRREGLALSRLSHPNIEMVLDLGEESGTDYLVLEFVPGETLNSRLARGKIPEREAAELCAQVADALVEAHDRGVLHRIARPLAKPSTLRSAPRQSPRARRQVTLSPGTRWGRGCAMGKGWA